MDSRPQANTHFRIAKAAGGVAYAPSQVGQLYDYPAQLDGSGESIGILELGGGYNIRDLETYFSGIGIKTPNVLSVSVDGAANSPTGDPGGPDAEVVLDVEVAGSIAPMAQIVVYFAPNTDAGFVDAVLAAIHDMEHKPSVLSVSWGSGVDLDAARYGDSESGVAGCGTTRRLGLRSSRRRRFIRRSYGWTLSRRFPDVITVCARVWRYKAEFHG